MARALQVEFLLAGITDSSGDPLSGGKVYSYEAGTSTAKALYTDQGQVTAATNPVILDAYGRASVFAVGAYKLVIKNSADVTLHTIDSLQYIYPDQLALYCGTATGSSNNFVLSPSPALTAYTDGLTVSFISNHATSGAATLNISSLGAKDFVGPDGSTALTTGDILDDGIVNAQYIAGSDHFRLINAAGVVSVSAGGTGAANAADACENLGVGVTDSPTFANVRLGSGGRIGPNTSDGSDSQHSIFGHADSTRGGSVFCAGNEHGSLAGQTLVTAGNVSGGKIVLQTIGSQDIDVTLNSTRAWIYQGSGGHLVPEATNTVNIGSTSKRLASLYVANDIIQTLKTWSPAVTANGGGSISSESILESGYCRCGAFYNFDLVMTFTLTGASTTEIYITVPVAGTAHNIASSFICTINEGSSTVGDGGRWRYDGTQFLLTKPANVAFTAGAISVHIQGRYKP